eukprot:scaffold803_cov310-Pinguiococcus_pyrenoidosus.AAC.52
MVGGQVLEQVERIADNGSWKVVRGLGTELVTHFAPSLRNRQACRRTSIDASSASTPPSAAMISAFRGSAASLPRVSEQPRSTFGGGTHRVCQAIPAATTLSKRATMQPQHLDGGLRRSALRGHLQILAPARIGRRQHLRVKPAVRKPYVQRNQGQKRPRNLAQTVHRVACQLLELLVLIHRAHESLHLVLETHGAATRASRRSDRRRKPRRIEAAPSGIARSPPTMHQSLQRPPQTREPRATDRIASKLRRKSDGRRRLRDVRRVTFGGDIGSANTGATERSRNQEYRSSIGRILRGR